MKRSLGLLLLVLCIACGTKDPAPPADILDREKFKTVLLEAQLLEARMNHDLTVMHSGEVNAERQYATLFLEQGVTKEQFKKTFDYYTEHPEKLKVIYEEIITELSKRKDSL